MAAAVATPETTPQATPGETTALAGTATVETPKPDANADAVAAAAAAAAAATTPVTPKPGETAPASTKPEGTTAPATVPVVPETYDLKLPDQSPFEATDLTGFSEEAKALKLTSEQAQQMVDARIAQVQAFSAQYLVDLKADPELGGAKFDESVQLALKGRDVLFPPNSDEAAFMNRFFEKTGSGNHKLLVRAFARLGRMVSEDGTSIAKAGSADVRTAAQKLYPGMT